MPNYCQSRIDKNTDSLKFLTYSHQNLIFIAQFFFTNRVKVFSKSHRSQSHSIAVPNPYFSRVDDIVWLNQNFDIIAPRPYVSCTTSLLVQPNSKFRNATGLIYPSKTQFTRAKFLISHAKEFSTCIKKRSDQLYCFEIEQGIIAA